MQQACQNFSGKSLLPRIEAEIRRCMQEDSIQSQGGKARAKALSPEQLSTIAAEAAKARWANRPIQATHKGSFKEHFGIDVDCYVLGDEHKTPVMSQRGMGKALGLAADQGNAFARFLATKKTAEIAGAELMDKLAQPIKFQWGTGGADQPPAIVHGYDASLLIDLCRAIVAAEAKDALGARLQRVMGSGALSRVGSHRGPLLQARGTFKLGHYPEYGESLRNIENHSWQTENHASLVGNHGGILRNDAVRRGRFAEYGESLRNIENHCGIERITDEQVENHCRIEKTN
jgi:hypothetical protein